MVKSPITTEGNIRYFELFKLSVLVAFFYALISSIITANMVLILACSGLLSSIVFILVVINILVISLTIIEVLKDYVDIKLFITLPKRVYLVLRTIIFERRTLVFVQSDITILYRVVRC